ncbi:hypothetical protein D3C87_1062430 [compost metagenome]
MLLDLRTSAEYAHVIDDFRCPLHLRIDAVEFVGQVIDLHIAVAQALEHVDDGHAHHVQRLIDFMGEAGGHFAKGGHFRALCELLLRAAHLGVVSAHRLHFDQLAVLIEHAAIGPHPPGMFSAGQLQADFRGAHRLLHGQCSETLDERSTLFLGHPAAQIDPWQFLRRAFQILRQRPVAKGQNQIRAIATDHCRRVFDQNPIALFTLFHLFGCQGRLGDV